MVEVVDLNADLGERDNEHAVPNDDALMREITSANIACGAHAGNPAVMGATIRLAMKHGVAVGAHPSFEDRAGFGRTPMTLPAPVLEQLVTRQIRLLASIAAAEGTRLRHVKPHGALYNLATHDLATADAIARAVCATDSSLALVGLAGSELVRAAARAGLRAISEMFVDRRYGTDGRLVSRSEPHAVITSPDEAVEQTIRLLRDHSAEAATICVHGDTPGALAIARHVRAALVARGIALRAAT